MFKPGDRVVWKDKKHGEYFGCVRHTVRYKGKHLLAVVHFDGNKHASRVPVVELRLERNL